MYSKILIATDGSETARKAARIGVDLAAATGAEALVLHVGDPGRGRQVLEETEKELGGGIRTLNLEGDPADQILEVAERENADLIIVGNKGMTGARRFLLGSVPNQISHHAKTNVLIAKTT